MIFLLTKNVTTLRPSSGTMYYS